MIRNWHPGSERTPKGFYKGLSVLSRVDPFTGESKGSPAMAPVATVAAASGPSSESTEMPAAP